MSQVNVMSLPGFLPIIALLVGAATEEAAGQEVIIAAGDALPQVRVTTSLADARGILSVADYDEIQVAVSRDSTVGFVTEITRTLGGAGSRVAFVGAQDTLGHEAVLVMREGYVGELRLRPSNERHFAQTITAIQPVAVDLVVDPETPMSTVTWIQNQLVESGVRRVISRVRYSWRASQARRRSASSPADGSSSAW